MPANAANNIDDKIAVGPMTGFRILEIGHYIAAPFASRLLADMGADVIKVEGPNGDPVRSWGDQLEGQSIWWSVHGRNKRSITLNLKAEGAKDILGKLVQECDAIIENFRPGQLAKLGFSDEFFREQNPEVVICHISGYGQTGPLAKRACFGVIGEAIGGLRHLTDHMPGQSELPPVRTGISIGDSIAGLYGALGVVASLAARSPKASRTIDVALTESVLSVLEGTLPEYSITGKVREPSGGRIPTASPSNAFRTKDDKWVIIAANSDQLFAKLCNLMGSSDLPYDTRFSNNMARVANVDLLEDEISRWSKKYTGQDLENLLEEHDIPSCRVFRVTDIVADAQYNERNMVMQVEDRDLGPVTHPGAVPLFEGVPRNVRWTGPKIGEHNEAVYCGILDIKPDRFHQLCSEGVI